MRLDGFDLNLLVALDMLLAERNVTIAAERLFMSQSAMSSALTRMREYFADDLLVKSGSHMKLTPLAESLVEPVHDVLSRVRGTIIERPVFDPATSTRRFSLMMVDGTAALLMPQVLAEAARCAPGIAFEVQLQRPQLLDDLERGEIDLAIVALEFASKEHPSEVLMESDYVCVVWSQSSSFGSSISKDQYLAAGHVIVRFGKTERLLSFEEWSVKQLRGRRRVEVVAPTFDAAARFVVGTDRVATLPRGLAQAYQQFLPIRLLASPLPIPRLRLAMQWNTARQRDGANQWLRGLVRSAGQNTDPDNALRQQREHPLA